MGRVKQPSTFLAGLASANVIFVDYKEGTPDHTSSTKLVYIVNTVVCRNIVIVQPHKWICVF